MSRWLAGLEERARAVLPPHVYDYVATGARDGRSRDEAEAAWGEVRFWPHVLRDVTDVSLRTSFLGAEHAAPWAVAPSSLQGQVHPDGETAMLRASAEAGARERPGPPRRNPRCRRPARTRRRA